MIKKNSNEIIIYIQKNSRRNFVLLYILNLYSIVYIVESIKNDLTEINPKIELITYFWFYFGFFMHKEHIVF